MDEFLRFERVEFERIVGERNFKQREPYDAELKISKEEIIVSDALQGAQFEKLGIYQSRWNHHFHNIFPQISHFFR